MTGDRDPQTPVSAPNGQYNPATSATPIPFSDAGHSPFDTLTLVADVEGCLVDVVRGLAGSDIASVALFRTDSHQKCLVGRVVSGGVCGDSDPKPASGLSELSRKLRRVRFSIEDTELGPVAALVAASGGATGDDAGSALETEDPAELVKILGAGPWSYWTILGTRGALGVLAISGTLGAAVAVFEGLIRAGGRALERTKTQADWDRIARQQRRLQDVATTVCRSRNLTELHRRLIRIVARGTSAPWARFFGGGEVDSEFRMLAQCGAVPESSGFEAALEQEVRPVWETLRPRHWSGYAGDTDARRTGPVWLIPVHAFDRALGVLAIGRLAEELIGDMDRDEPFLQSVAGQFALAIRNSEIGEELRVNRQRLREIQGQLLRSERMAVIGETAAELASQASPGAAAVYQSCRELLESMEETDPHAEPMEGICRELLRLEALLREQVDLGRLTRPRLVMCGLGTLVEECTAVVRDDARLAGVEVTMEIGSELPELLLDHEKVRTVVTNLLRSAIEGLRAGDRLRVETQQTGHHLLLEVTAAGQSEDEASEPVASIDSGDLLARLFAPFASAQAGGTTLGLAVARQIVVDHGGELDVRKQGERTFVYRLRLPIRDNRDRRLGQDRRGRDRRRAA